MKFNTFSAIALTAASLVITLPANADTVNASCSIYPKGSDRASWYGSCTFSQRQGFVGIQLDNGQRYDLSPTEEPNTYKDQNGNPAHRELEGGYRQIYRLPTESIFVTFDEGAGGQNSGNTSGQPEVGTTVSALSDLVGARAGQAENTITQRGYRFVKSAPSGNEAVYSYWLEGETNYCVIIRTEQGRYQSIVYAGGSSDCEK